MTADLIPFGKYKDQSVAAVMASDPGYVEWLTAQDWFAQKYRPIYNIMVQALPQQDLTPEHNALQARFLDDGFVARILQHVCPDYSGPPRSRLFFTEHSSYYTHISASFIRVTKRRMEGVSDVDIEALYDTSTQRTESEKPRREERTAHFHFELKPSLGDDYPAVMRQIKAQRGKRVPHPYARGEYECPYANDVFVLAYGSFTAKGATEEQVRQMLSESNIVPVSLNDAVTAENPA